MKTSEFIEIYKTYITRYLKPSSVDLYRLCLDKYINPEFGNIDLDEVRRVDVIRLHSLLDDRPYMANRVVAVGRRMYSYAATIEIIEDSFNPFKKVQLYREFQRDRHLDQSEYQIILETMDRLESEQRVSKFAVAAVKVLMLTGCRRSEIETLKWEDVRLDEGIARLPDSKTGPRVVELTAIIVDILKELKSEATGLYVFQGRYRGTPVRLKKYWAKICSEAGLEGVRLHDLRHSFATLASANGVPMQVIAKLLGHTTVWTTARYLHASRKMTAQAAMEVGELIIRG